MFQASRLKAANSRSLIATPFITLPAAEGNQKRQAYRVCLRTTSCLLLCAGRPDRSWLLLAAGATVGTDGGGVADLRHGGGGQSNDGPPRRQPTSTPEPLTADPDLIALQARFYKSGAKFKGFSGPVGSGKTVALYYEALRAASRNPGCLGLIGAPTYAHLYDVTIPAMVGRAFFSGAMGS